MPVMAKAQPGHRVTIQLDRRVALESILLNRLGQMPVKRRQEWLRGLLVQGFRNECQVLKGLSVVSVPPPVNAFTRDPVESKGLATADDGPSVSRQPPKVNHADKPFAALCKVIG